MIDDSLEKYAMEKEAIIGGSSGIGLALCRHLKAKGVEVAICARDEAKLIEVKNSLGDIFVRSVDATHFDEVENFFREIKEKIGSLTAVVNCAGAILVKPAHLTREDEYRQVIEQNLTTAFAVVKYGSQIISQEGGSIILFSSAAARIGIKQHEVVAAAKAGIVGLTLSAAATYAPRIRVNCVAPGLVDTPLASKIFTNQRALEYSQNVHALKRTGTAEEIASLVAYLIDPQSSWITGQVIGIDGGLGSIQPV